MNIFVSLAFLGVLFCGRADFCHAQASAVSPSSALAVQPSSQPAAVWQPLLERLAEDGIAGPDVALLFARLGDAVTQDPMGRKVRELYKRSFMRPPPDPSAPKKPRPILYKNIVTEENVHLCREFLQRHAPYFALAEMRYHVPKEIAVALMFVETRLGTVLGTEGAMFTLASMALSTEPEHISAWLPELTGYEEHLDWMRELMPKRADWAYKELKALLVFSRKQGLDPLAMPGSIYGAVGICQFMPSNLDRLGADGDGDGIVDLFNVADAIASLSHYLVKNGWRAGMTRERQHTLLKSYNRIDIYANTILSLADAVEGVQRPLPVPARAKGKK